MNPKPAPAASVLLNANPGILAIASAMVYNLLLLPKHLSKKNTRIAFAGNACWN